jgi:uncharacterized membrane protein
MKGKLAVILFLLVCITLSILLITRVITPIFSGSIFAIALVLLGGVSQGFKKK